MTPPTWLFLPFGLGSWLLVNALWCEVPAVVDRLPEGYGISAYMIMCLAVGNLTPAVTVTLCARTLKRFPLASQVAVLLALSVATAVLLALLWNQETEVAGHRHSVAWLCLTTLAGMLAALTNVTFFPFVSEYPRACTTAVTTGESISGLFSSVLALAQGAGSSSLRFSVASYFICIASLFVVSASAFVWIVMSTSSEPGRPDNGVADAPPTAMAAPAVPVGEAQTNPLLEPEQPGYPLPLPDKCDAASSVNGHAESSQAGYRRFVRSVIMVQVAVSVVANGLAPSLLPYATKGYHSSGQVLLWASNLGMIALPGATLMVGLPSLAQRLGLSHLVWGTVIGILATVVLLVCAACRSTPPLHAWSGGGALPVLASVVVYACDGFVYTGGYLILHDTAGRSAGANEAELQANYRLAGCASLAGSTVGGIAAFFLVIVLKVFG